MIGFGFSPFGTSLWGLGSPEEGTPLGGVTEAARYLDPVTKDFLADDDGRLMATTSVQQRVYLALNTTFGSATADLVMGNRIREVLFIGDNFASVVRSHVRQALKQLTDIEQVISILSIDVQTQGSSSLITLTYLDRTTNFTDSVAYSL